MGLLIFAASASTTSQPDSGFVIRDAVESGSAPVPYLVTQTELDTFTGNMAARYGIRSYDSALYDVHKNEQRDNDWAVRAENEVAAAVSEHQKEGMVVKGECRTSRCRFDMTVPKGKSAFGDSQAFRTALFLRLKNAQISNEISNHTDEKPQTDILYIYGLAPPEHYVDALLARLRSNAPTTGEPLPCTTRDRAAPAVTHPRGQTL